MNDKQQEHVRVITTTLRIIVGALMAGVLAFAAVVMILHPPDVNAEGGGGVLSLIAVGATLVAIVAAVVVPMIMRSSFRRAIVEGKPLGQNSLPPQFAELGDVGRVTGAYQSTKIIGAAILEGAAFLNLTSYMNEHQVINLGCAALLLVGLAFKFPTHNEIETFVKDEPRQIEELRALGR